MSETWDGPIRCGWCGVTMQEGDKSKPTSHGICEPCSDALEAEAS